MQMNPGAVIDVYLWRQEYDDEQHGLKRKGVAGDGGERAQDSDDVGA